MSYQIAAIVLYGPVEEPRVLHLRPGKVNVITGASRTGKSALISIVDYCFGSKCKVPRGPIRRSVEWYGLKLVSGGQETLVLRRAPAVGKAEAGDCYVEVADSVSYPRKSGIKPNILSADKLEDFLSSRAGIRDNLFEPQPGQTRPSLAAQVRHALLFCFQTQDEIISKDRLFHRQGDPFMPQTIKDILPYFLGAVDEDRLVQQRRLRDLKQELRKIERQIAELAAVRGDGTGRAVQLLREARDLGLPVAVSAEMAFEEALAGLRELQQARPLSRDIEPSIDGREYENLLAQQETLRQQLQQAQQELDAARAVSEAEKGFEKTVGVQMGRLTPLGLFAGDEGDTLCPVCTAPVPEGPGRDDIRRIQESLRSKLEGVTSNVPHLEQLLATLEEKVARARRSVGENRAAMSAIVKQRERISEMRDTNSRQAHVLGRISLYLESVPETSLEPNTLQAKAQRLTAEMSVLEAALGKDTMDDRLASAISRISWKLTKWAEKLGLEHSDSPIRFDPKTLTVVADTLPPTTMDEMGSGSNFAGYHVAFHLALHHYLSNNRRPVPRFLFLDQPSEVYFPADRDAVKLQGGKDEEREAVILMFTVIWAAVEELQGDFQVVIAEHADLDEQWFQESIAERWRQGDALIPKEWLDEHTDGVVDGDDSDVE